MVFQEQDEKITYTTMSVEQATDFNRRFDDAIGRVHARLGKEYPAYVDGKSVEAGETFELRGPVDTRLVLGKFQQCSEEHVRAAVEAAHRVQSRWSQIPWQERVSVLRSAADNLRSKRYDIAAWLSLEAGKSRLEAMGEVEEAADLIHTYCEQMEDHHGFIIKLKQLTPNEVNHSVLRPYGVFAVIAPFNFPVALSTGMIAAALVSGNTVVYKPSPETPLSGVHVTECFLESGLPEGVLNLLTGEDDGIGKALVHHPGVDGVAFIGSAAVGAQIYREFSSRRPRPVIAEMGGKNPVIVTQSADLEKAVEGTVRAAFGYSGQKCSAASRVYVENQVADEFVQRLKDRTESLSIGDPSAPDVFMGPVITAEACERFQRAVETARRDGSIVVGGFPLTSGEMAYGYYCSPTIALLPKNHKYFYEELFVPFLAVARVHSLSEAIELANDSEYGLTAGIFTEDEQEQRTFLDSIEAGVVYVNRRSGATTGAWPGVQSFGGWKASGSTGKSALGPYYVQQFLHEQNQTVVSD